jgi:hypothetical protein
LAHPGVRIVVIVLALAAAMLLVVGLSAVL